jgi:S-formylglutathione hydrolase FrmB
MLGWSDVTGGGAVLPWSSELAGRIDEQLLVSEQLRGNPLGDPHERPLWVHVPPGYDDEPDRRYPVVVVIQGYTGTVSMWRNRGPWRQPFPELADAVLADGATPPGIVVYVDAWTALGGSQYLDSPAIGRYHSYLCDEVVPFVDARYRTLPDRRHRAIAGKSSGGYGAMATAMRRPELFGALATHAGDALFEVSLADSFGRLARHLRAYDGDYGRFLADFRSRVALTREGDAALIEMYGYASAYSSDPDGTVHLPFDPVTGRLRPDVWERWLAHDPVRMAERSPYREALASMVAVWIDAGTRDEYFLDLGATAFRDAALAAGLPPERLHFELFDAGHAAIEYRYPLSLAWLLERIAP